MKHHGQPHYNKTELASGLRVVTERIPHIRSIAFGVWLLAGSRDEVECNNGIAHFVEHMVFKGTPTQSASQIAQSLESVGGHLNAFTSKELTCYYAHVLDEHLPIAVRVIADILLNSNFDEIEIEKEKRVVLEELNAVEEAPEELIHDHFYKRLFPDHPLGLPIIGQRDSIREFSADSIRAFVDDNYTANRIVVAATGNVEHKSLVQLVRKHFADFKPAPKPTYPAVESQTTGREVSRNGAIQAHICLGTHAYSYTDSRKFTLLVLNTLLGAGMSSRLFQNIRERHGIAYSIYSFIDFLFDTGIFGVYVGTDPKGVDRAIDLIHLELSELCSKLVSKDELERTKSQLKGNLMLGLEGTSSRMNRLSKMEIYLQQFFSLDDTLAGIEAVTTNALSQTANELFKQDKLYTIVLEPGTGQEKEREL